MFSMQPIDTSGTEKRHQHNIHEKRCAELFMSFILTPADGKLNMALPYF